MTAGGSFAAVLRGDWDEGCRPGSEASRLGGEQGFPWLAAVGNLAVGFGAIRAGDRGAIDRYMAAMQEVAATGLRRAESWLVGMLADALLSLGRLEGALAQVEGAVDLTGATGEVVFLADLYRLKGEILRALGGPGFDQTEALLREAIEIARSQEAKLFELRAATSLARLWRDQRRRTEARDLLRPIYAWFTEGFDMQDLKEGKRLLEELES